MEEGFWQEVRQYEEVNHMPYITSVERIGIRKGIEQGLQEGIQQGMQRGLQQGLQQRAREDIRDVLEARFGTAPPQVAAALTNLEDLAKLKALLRQASTVGTLAEFLRHLR